MKKMPRPKLTDEQKLQNKLAKKAAAYAKQQEIYAEVAKASREKVLASLDNELKQKFESSLKFAENCNNSFAKDIAGKWQQYGTLSEKQINALVSCVERDKKKKVVTQVIDNFFVVGKSFSLKNLEVNKIQEAEVFDNYNQRIGFINKITLKNKSGIFFTVKTNAVRLVKAFTSAIDHSHLVTIDATVKWHYENSDTVILTPRGMKVLIQDV